MKRLFAILLILLALTGCSTPDAVPTATNKPVPSSTATQTATATATFTLSPTLTPSLTPSPSPTVTSSSTPTTTPTPDGYYVNNGAAFSIILPSGWEALEDNPTGAVFEDSRNFLSLYVSSIPGEEVSTIDEGLGELVGELGKDASLDERDQVNLGNGVIAERAKFTVETEGIEVRLHLIYVQKDKRTYSLMLIGPAVTFDNRSLLLSNMLGSIQLLTGQIYGLDRDESIVLMGYDPEPEYLDPARAEDSPAGYLGNLYSGLVRLSPELSIEPDLAESWTVSEDGTVYTFVLREGLTFQSGNPLTAEDVKYSLERAADPETNSPTAATYLGDILGLKERLSGEADEILGVKVIDDLTIEITLDAPKPYFLAKFTYTPSLVVDRETIESAPDDWMLEPNASGPFKLKEFIEEDALIFERNEAYHTPAGVRYAIYLLYRPGPRIDYFEAGDIDITGLSVDEYQQVQDETDPLHDQLHSTTLLCTSMIKFNNNLPPMDDINVRKALALSIDRGHMLEVFSENLSPLANSILPPSMPGFSPDVKFDAFDPEAAQAALAESDYADETITLTLLDMGYGDSEDPYTNALIDMWQENLGIEVVVEYIDPIDFTNEARNIEAHVLPYAWCADYPDPENFLDILFHSASDYNSVNYFNPGLDALLEEARVELDIERRLALYKQAEILLLADFGAIPMQYSVSRTLVSPRISGYIDSPAVVVPYIHRLTVVDQVSGE